MPELLGGKLYLRILGSCIRVLEEYLDLSDPSSLGIPLLADLPPDVLRRAKGERPIPLDRCQRVVQRAVDQKRRKELAVYYSKDEALRLMEEAVGMIEGEVVLGDPFMGSGRTLSHLLPLVRDRLVKVWGVERLSLPALVAYTSLLHLLGGERDLIEVKVGDAFLLHARRELPVSNLIATNPPFTRWDKLPPDYRKRVVSLFRATHGNYLGRGWMSLQALAMLLVDDVLEEGGVLASVLPASTFYTIYGRGIKGMLRDRYHLALIAEGSDSFSEGSGFKEVVIIARKGGDGPTKVISSSGSPSSLYLRDLPPLFNMNWLSLFDGRLRDLVMRFLKPALASGRLVRLSETGIRVVRGVEMYGPDFFFLPNRFWTLEFSEERAILKGEEELEIPAGYLRRALRRPSMYSHTIEVRPDTYALAIPPLTLEELPEGVASYVEWGLRSGTAAPAIRARGRLWYSHIWRQLVSKKPYGHLFLPDKVGDPLRRSSIANLSEERITATKNFYVVIADPGRSREMAAWYNSTYFASLLILMGRKISRGWTRFLLADYLEMPVLNVSEPGEDLLPALEALAKESLPIGEGIVRRGARYELDRILGRMMAVPGPDSLLDELYDALLSRDGG